jgi:hypothetical protein
MVEKKSWSDAVNEPQDKDKEAVKFVSEAIKEIIKERMPEITVAVGDKKSLYTVNHEAHGKILYVTEDTKSHQFNVVVKPEAKIPEVITLLEKKLFSGNEGTMSPVLSEGYRVTFKGDAEILAKHIKNNYPDIAAAVQKKIDSGSKGVPTR